MSQGLDSIVRALLYEEPRDTANARFLVPLEDAELEQLAHRGACVAVSCFFMPLFDDNITMEEPDLIWEQSLIHARRLLYGCDEDFARMIRRQLGCPRSPDIPSDPNIPF